MKVLRWRRCQSGWQSSQPMMIKRDKKNANLQKPSSRRHDLRGWTFNRSRRLMLGSSLCRGSMENPSGRADSSSTCVMPRCNTFAASDAVTLSSTAAIVNFGTPAWNALLWSRQSSCCWCISCCVAGSSIKSLQQFAETTLEVSSWTRQPCCGCAGGCGHS